MVFIFKDQRSLFYIMIGQMLHILSFLYEGRSSGLVVYKNVI